MDNYKLAFIHGHSDKERNIQEGKIEKYGVLDEGSLHILSLLDYAKETYPDVPIFKQLNDRYAPEAVGYIYTKLGDIVFLNMTTDVQKYGKTGLIMLPDNITEKQKEGLYTLAEMIDGYSICISYDLELVDGILEGKELYTVENQKPTKVLDSYFQKISPKSKTK